LPAFNFKTSAEELKYYLKESHRIVFLGLTKKKQKELGRLQKKRAIPNRRPETLNIREFVYCPPSNGLE
jgi:hypothetical protein